jgi:preprotein translocase subunit SecG
MLAIIVKGFHLIVCIALIVIVLFQADKGEGLAGAFGGGASSTLFGERGGATEISKFTTGLAVVFMITSLVIAIWGPTWEKEADIARTNAYNSQPIVATPAKTQTPAPVATPNAAMPGLPMTAPVTNPAPITATPAPAAATPAPVETPAPAAVAPAPVETPAPAVENKPAETSAAPSVKEELKEKAESAVKAIVEEKKAEVIEAIKDKVENK